jgi:serine/threonine protein kinase
MNDLIGKNLGRYHIIEPLGQGGMASVYKAFDTSLERHVAIKIIRPDIEIDNQSEFLKRFQREAKSLAQLDHPYILKVLDYGDQEGLPYLVMPFLEGGTLKEKMGKPMPYSQAASLLTPIAEALDYAHKRNIIHRDVKPANILISQSGAPILSDFGIAKILVQSGSTQLTGAGVGIGTPDYMAPEQWTGTADARTDIYSLGVVFYQMVTGRLPFSADTPAAVLIKHLRDPLPRPRAFVHDLPEVVEQILFKALAKEPENRFQTMKEFASTLEKLERSDETVIGSSALDFETVKSVDVSGIPAAGTVIAKQPAAPKKKLGTGTIALIAVGVLVVLGIVCVVLGGGTYFASQWFTTSQVDETVPAVIIDTPVVAPTSESIFEQPTQPTQQDQPDQPADTPGSGQSFATIQGYPEDVPLLTVNNGDLSTTTAQGMQMYSFTSSLSVDEVEGFYDSGLVENGWEETARTTQEGSIMVYYMKADRIAMITVAPDDNGSFISVMVGSQ